MQFARPNAISVNRQSWLLVAISLLAWFLRRPKELLVGYFYAEEGSTYFHFAWNATPLHALLAPHQGYYSLYPNLMMLIAARLLPVRAAAAFGAWCALTIVLLMVYLIAQCELFRTFQERALAIAAVLLTAPDLTMTLSTINSQYYFGICTAVILLSSTQRLRGLRLLTLIVAGLTGVVSCFFTPFYWIKAVLEHSRAIALRAALLTCCTAVQGIVVWRMLHVLARGITPHHSLSIFLDSLLLNGPIMEFLSRFTWYFASGFLLTHRSAVILGSVAVLSIFVLASLVISLWRAGGASRWLVAMGIFAGVISLSGALGDASTFLRGTDRYLLVGNTLIALSLLVALLRSGRRNDGQLLFAALMLGIFVSGLVDVPFYLRMVRGEASWPAQAARWKANEQINLVEAPHNWTGHPFVISHKHQDRNDLPDYIYDSISLRSAGSKDLSAGPHTGPK